MPTNITNITRTPTPPGNATATVYNTSNASGEVVATTGNGVPVIVEQGPAWLAQIAYQPPSWVGPALAILFLGIVGLAGVGYYRHGIDEDVLREMSEAVMTVVCVLFVAMVVRGHPGLSYIQEAVLAGGGGWLLAQLVIWVVYRATDDSSADSA